MGYESAIWLSNGKLPEGDTPWLWQHMQHMHREALLPGNPLEGRRGALSLSGHPLGHTEGSDSHTSSTHNHTLRARPPAQQRYLNQLKIHAVWFAEEQPATGIPSSQNVQIWHFLQLEKVLGVTCATHWCSVVYRGSYMLCLLRGTWWLGSAKCAMQSPYLMLLTVLGGAHSKPSRPFGLYWFLLPVTT